MPNTQDLGVRIRDGLRFGGSVFATVWVGWALLGLVGVTIVPASDSPGVPGLDGQPVTGGWHNLFYAGERGDAYWFERIAMSGYRTDDGSAAFLPLYPMAIRLIMLTGLGSATAAILVAQACFFGVLVLIWAITAREFGRGTAKRATIYLAAFPTAFFFLVPYTEAPFLLLVLLAFWYARRGEWEWAVFPALGAGLTRSAGIVLCAALAVEAFVQWRRHGAKLYPGLAASCAPAVGLGLYFAYWAGQGALWAPVKAQENWQREWTFPARTIWDAVVQAYEYRGFWLIDLLVFGFVLVVVVWGARTLPWSWTTFALASLLMPLSNPFPGRVLMSMPRFTAVVFPIFVMLAIAAGRKQIRHSLILGAFAAGWALLGLLFLNGYALF